MSDNPALSAALDRAGSLIPVFIFDPTGFTAWAEGCTGYPVVDLAMRQLKASGSSTTGARDCRFVSDKRPADRLALMALSRMGIYP